MYNSTQGRDDLALPSELSSLAKSATIYGEGPSKRTFQRATRQ